MDSTFEFCAVRWQVIAEATIAFLKLRYNIPVLPVKVAFDHQHLSYPSQMTLTSPDLCTLAQTPIWETLSYKTNLGMMRSFYPAPNLEFCAVRFLRHHH